MLENRLWLEVKVETVYDVLLLYSIVREVLSTTRVERQVSAYLKKRRLR